MTGIFEVHVHSITTGGTQTLIIDTADAERMNGKRILIVDDVISTGESLRAMEELCEEGRRQHRRQDGGLAEGGAIERHDITVLAPCLSSTRTERSRTNEKWEPNLGSH